ncbi:MAG TPA: ABC transporter permease [Ktedonobacterales bacterium]|nr:ABC transporter permease [Ktedonobacterales bacterium]
MIEAIRNRGQRSAVREAASYVSGEASKGFAFIERNWYLTKRYAWWELVWITYNVVNALAVTFIAAATQKLLPGVHFKQADINYIILYLVIGTAIWSFVSVVFDNVTETVTIERWEGTIEYTFMAPVSRLTHMLGTCTFAIVHGLVLTVVQLVVVSLFFHLDISHANLGASALILLVGSISFIGLGTMGAVLPLLYTERGAQMTYIIRAVMLLVSGVYYPISVLPGWLQPLSAISPATYVLDGLRLAILGGKGIPALWGDIWPLIICGIVSLPVGLAIFNAGERYAKRTGRLKRNG